MDCEVLLVFVKHPAPGKVKTRLAHNIGDEQAALIYRVFVETILRRMQDKSFRTIVCHYPAENKDDFARWLGKETAMISQQGNDLGERMENAFSHVFFEGAKRVIVIGTASPLLGKKTVKDAFRVLKRATAVIGPSSDGGYYLLGLSMLHTELFKNISWGTSQVFRQTMESARLAGVSPVLLEEHFDVDTKEDIVALRERMRLLPRAKVRHLRQLRTTINALEYSPL